MESAKRWEKVFGFTHKKFGEKIKKKVLWFFLVLQIVSSTLQVTFGSHSVAKSQTSFYFSLMFEKSLGLNS